MKTLILGTYNADLFNTVQKELQIQMLLEEREKRQKAMEEGGEEEIERSETATQFEQ